MLAGSAAVAHGITAASLPVMSRLYSPADFSALAVFAGLASVLSAVAALRYDIAVPLPEEHEDALNLLTLSIVLSTASATVLVVLVAWQSAWLAELLNQPRLRPYLWLLPLAVLTASTYSSLQSWFVRRKQFAVIASSRIWQSSVSVGTQAGLGYLAFAPLGLLAGYVANTGAACLVLGRRLLREEGAVMRRAVRPRHMRRQLELYQRFPRYSTLEALCNNGSVHLPIVLVAVYAAGPEAGYIALAMMLMQAPMSLVGAAIGQVYLSRAAEEHRNGQLAAVTAETLSYLMRTGVGPLLAVGIAAPFVFDLVFGDGWRRAGQLVSWMTPWFVLQFLAVPVGMALHVTGQQRRAFALQALGLVVRVAAVVLAARVAGGHVGEAYALSGMLFYGIYLIAVLSATGNSMAEIRHVVAQGVGHVGAWLVVGVAVALAGIALQ
jgi:O-antigen/teichoic acid export membrane protein